MSYINASDRASPSLCNRSLGHQFGHTRASLAIHDRDGHQRKDVLLRLMFDSDDLSPAIGRFCTGVCLHFNGGPWTRPVVSDLISCKLQHGDAREGCPTRHPSHKCDLCAMEVHVGVRQLQHGRGKALVTTKCMDLGRGNSGQGDERWSRHLFNPWRSVSRARLVLLKAEGSVRGAFETGHRMPTLTDELAAVLEKDLYPKRFERRKVRGLEGRVVYDNAWKPVPGWKGCCLRDFETLRSRSATCQSRASSQLSGAMLVNRDGVRLSLISAVRQESGRKGQKVYNQTSEPDAEFVDATCLYAYSLDR